MKTLFLAATVGFFTLSVGVQSSYAQTAQQETDTSITEELSDLANNATQSAQSISEELLERLQRVEIPDVGVPNINFPDLDLSGADPAILANLYNEDPDIDQAPFPPPVAGGQTRAPDYTIDIPHSVGGENLTYEPAEIGVPIGTTVMWINKDSAPHTVTTIEEGRESPPPESFDSGFIPAKRGGLFEVTPFGGSFIHTFDTPGVYNYACAIHPEHHGRIVVGDTIQLGQKGSMALLQGANVPFNSSELSRIVLAVVPSTDVIDLPPTTTVTYEVSISGPSPQTGGNQFAFGHNDVNEVIYEDHQFLDSDGILHLELVPQPQVNGTSADFTTWGPDISGSATGPHTGAFHIEGPVLIQEEPYTLTVSIINIDDRMLEEPITEAFILSPALANPS